MQISPGAVRYMRSAVFAVHTPCLRRCNPVTSRLPTLQINRSFSRSRISRARADDPDFVSLVDEPTLLVKQKSRHGWGLIVLGM